MTFGAVIRRVIAIALTFAGMLSLCHGVEHGWDASGAHDAIALADATFSLVFAAICLGGVFAIEIFRKLDECPKAE